VRQSQAPRQIELFILLAPRSWIQSPAPSFWGQVFHLNIFRSLAWRRIVQKQSWDAKRARRCLGDFRANPARPCASPGAVGSRPLTVGTAFQSLRSFHSLQSFHSVPRAGTLRRGGGGRRLTLHLSVDHFGCHPHACAIRACPVLS